MNKLVEELKGKVIFLENINELNQETINKSLETNRLLIKYLKKIKSQNQK